MRIAVFYENINDGAKAGGIPIADALTRLRDGGMDSLYLSVDSWERDRKDLAPILEKLNLPIEGMHGFCNFPGEPDALRYREMIDLAADAGAGHLLFVPGMLSTGNTKRDLDRMLDGMRKAVEYGRSRGLPILMEDFDGALAPYNCMAGLDFFLRNVPGLQCAFDTGNFVMFREDEREAFELFADQICTVHLKDRAAKPRHEGDQPFACADGTQAYTCVTGSGYIHIGEILQCLRERQYAGNVIIELFSCDAGHVLQDALESLKWVRERTVGARGISIPARR